jgi:hypothetical protein
MFKNLIKSSALAVAALALMTSAAFASDGTTAVVTGGSLSITNPLAANFVGRSITGADQETTAALDAFSVSDLTGSGAGWHVTAGASQFTRTPSGHNLAASSLLMSEPGVTPNGTTSPDPDVNAGPYTLDSGTAAVVASAALDEGMGTYDFDETLLTLSLPADVYAGSYASTVTISVVTAP